MKWLILLLFTALLNANNFPLVQPISVEKAPLLKVKAVANTTKIPKQIIKKEPQEALSGELPPQEIVLNNENISKKDISNELVKTKILKIKFEPSSAIISADSNDQVVKFANYLLQNEAIQVVIYGYTDSLGDEHTNLKLSQKRATSVTSALNALGISSTRLTAVGMGEKDPVASNDTLEGRAQNRRIEALIIE